MNHTAIIIPARMASSRLKAKVLLPIGNKSLLEQVWQRAVCVADCDVFVATDHETIADNVQAFGGNVIMTSPSCPSGSDRVAEAIQTLPDQYQNIINIQGDLPFIDPKEVPLVLMPLKQGYDVGTLITCMPSEKQENPSFVKAVVSPDSAPGIMRCHWFCRAALPYGHHHMGIYSYTRAALNTFAKTPPHPLEQQERLEQLRFLTLGYRIGASLVNSLAIEVNTSEDLSVAQAYADAIV